VVINTRIALTWIASLGLAAATIYWFDNLPLFPRDGNVRLDLLAALVAAFLGQIGVYATAMAPIAAFACAGRWSWSVRLLTIVSVPVGMGMLNLTMIAYETNRGPERGFEGLFQLLVVGLFYSTFVVCTLVWIVARNQPKSVDERDGCVNLADKV
jgi:hypothetical protein